MEIFADYHHEIIIPNEKIPVKFFSFSAHDANRIIPKHWHRSAELLFCVEGRLNVWLMDKKYELACGDFIFINSNQVHSTQSPEENTVIVLQIPGDFLQYFSDDPSLLISCNTLELDANKQEASHHIKDLLYQLYSHNTIKEKGYNLKIYSLLFELGYTLVRDFQKTSNLELMIKSQKHLDRLSLICSYIKENHQSSLSLNDVADKFGYTPQYLARFFQKYTGITFLNYLNSIRIDAAYQQLATSDLSIIQIAEESGFASAKAFNKVFKEIYHQSPGQFRKEMDKDK